MYAVLVSQHVTVEIDVLALKHIIELFAQPIRHLLVDVGRVHRLVIAVIEREHDSKLFQIGFDRRFHVRVL